MPICKPSKSEQLPGFIRPGGVLECRFELCQRILRRDWKQHRSGIWRPLVLFLVQFLYLQEDFPASQQMGDRLADSGERVDGGHGYV
jgi:hypothetical protein